MTAEPTFARWREQAVEGMEQVLSDKSESSRRNHVLEKKLTEAEQTIGRLALENDLLGKVAQQPT